MKVRYEKIPLRGALCPKGIFSPDMAERYRNWLLIVYPDSAPDNWIEILSSFQIPCAVSPLHDRDKNSDGTCKKPHYHVILKFGGYKSLYAVQNLSDMLSGVLPIPCHSVNGSYTYLSHSDIDDKVHYDPSDIRTFNGFGVSDDSHAILQEICAYILSNRVDNFESLISDFLSEPSYLSCIAKYSFMFKQLIK